jgi:hypothetical protein
MIVGYLDEAFSRVISRICEYAASGFINLCHRLLYSLAANFEGLTRFSLIKSHSVAHECVELWRLNSLLTRSLRETYAGVPRSMFISNAVKKRDDILDSASRAIIRSERNYNIFTGLFNALYN